MNLINSSNESCDEIVIEFIKYQLLRIFFNKKKFFWNLKMKNFCTVLHHRSPTAYRFLRNFFNLPTYLTLYRNLDNNIEKPGFSKPIETALKKIVENMEEKDKNIIICWDEIFLKKNLYYCSKGDLIEGYVDYGELGRRQAIANVSLVYFIKSIDGSLKMPIFFSTANNSTPAEIIHTQLFEIILPKLFDIGFKVRLLIFDMGTSNQKLFNRILKISYEQPYFIFNELKIFICYDYCHLIKLVRNNLLKYNIEFDDNKTAKWEHILTFFHLDTANNPRLCKKLSNQHLFLDNFSKQSVKLATQLLSRSVSSGIYFCVSQNLMTSDSLNTAEFIENFDTIFDCLNSTSPVNIMKPYKIQLAKDNLPFSFLKNCRKFISSLRLINKNDMKPVKDSPFKNGFLLTINSILELCVDLFENNIQSIKVRNLNQDLAENSFSIMRERSGCSHSLTRQFKSSFKILLVHNMLSASQKSNCSWDTDCLLTHISKVETPKSSLNSTEIASNTQNESFSSEEILNFNNFITENSSSYISGYIINRLTQRFNCQSCSEIIVENENTLRTDTIFLEYKSYNNIQKTHIIPTKKAVECITRMISIIRVHLRKTKTTFGLKRILNERINREINFDWIPECHKKVFSQNIFDILFSVLIHFHIKIQNRKFKIPSSFKRKKIEKFSH
jgi:hypothetical protein